MWLNSTTDLYNVKLLVIFNITLTQLEKPPLLNHQMKTSCGINDLSHKNIEVFSKKSLEANYECFDNQY